MAAFFAGAFTVAIFWTGSYLHEAPVDETSENPRVVSRESPEASGLETPAGADPDTPQRSEIPVFLMATVVSTNPARSLATLRIEGEPRGHAYRPGDALLDTTLETIEPRRVLLRRAGRLEFLELEAETGPVAEPSFAPAPLQVAPEGERTLPRSLVEAALASQTSLEHDLEPTSTLHDGHRLLELGDVEKGGFYSRLGLEPRDVLMRVDGEWVTDQENPLWAALRDHDELVLVVMREGTARSWRVHVE